MHNKCMHIFPFSSRKKKTSVIEITKLIFPSHWLKKLPNEKKRYVDLLIGAILVVLIPLTIASLNHQKTTLASGLVYLTSMLISWSDNLKNTIQQKLNFVNISKGNCSLDVIASD